MKRYKFCRLFCSKNNLLLLAILTVFWIPETYSFESSLAVDDKYSTFNLNSFLSYYEDIDSNESFRTIQNNKKWTKNVSGDVISLGFIDHPIWIRFSLDLSDGEDSEWYLVILYPLLQNTELVVFSQKTQEEVMRDTIDLLNGISPESTSSFRTIGFSLPSKLKGPVDIYLKVSSHTALQVPLALWSKDYLLQRENSETFLWGIYFGVIFALMIYNGFLFLSMRDIAYGYYVLTLVSICVLMLSMSGLGEYYLWGRQVSSDYILAISGIMLSFWLLCFSASFLKYEKSPKWILYLLRGEAFLAFILVFYIAVFPENGALVASSIGALSVFIIMLAGIVSWVSGVVIARYFVFAITSFSIGAILYLANVFAFLPSSNITNHAIQVGSMAEALLFSFALAHRIKEERRQKLHAMKKMEEAQKTILKVQQQALLQALHDPITKMPNDSFLINRLTELIRVEMGGDGIAVLLLTFPQLKEISSSMGRRLAEEIFESIMKNLNRELSNDVQTISIEAETGSSLAVIEFGSLVFLSRMGDQFRSINTIAEQALKFYDSAVDLGDTSIHLDVFCGVATYPKHGDRADLLLQHACSARDFGIRSLERLSFYSSEIDAFGRRRLALIGGLSYALKAREFELYLQPQYDCKTRTLSGAEALLRWNSDRFGVVSPVEFIEVAEEGGLMSDLTRFVIEESFRLIQGFKKSGLLLTLSINLSVQNLTDKKLISWIISLAEKKMINLSDIVFEVTETFMAEDMDLMVESLNLLTSTGASIALDDYGTGYASLAYLSRLPIHELKIDRSFISKIVKSDSDYQIVENTVKLARALQIKTVAEGVEDEKILAIVSRLGCDRVQGFHLAKPMPSDRFSEWVQMQAKAG